MKQWLESARSMGFETAAELDPARLIPRQEIRGQCAADRCRVYGKNWMCPPYCGSTETCAARIAACGSGILVQTVGRTEKLIDTAAYRRIEEEHLRRFYALCAAVREKEPKALCLGAGGCRVCGTCAWPEPCRAPEKACASMEAYGLFVTQVCRDCGVRYHYGERTVTYTSCILFPKNGSNSATRD